MEMDDFEPFLAACDQNTSGLIKALNESPTVETFLRDDSMRIPLFASVVEDANEAVRYTFDLDGVVVLLSDVSCIRAGIHYLFVGKVDCSKISNHWHILKKHLHLTLYTADGVNALRKSLGTVLAFVDGGYFLNISCVPANPNRAHPMFKNEMMAKAHAVGLINALYKHFEGQLKNLSPQDLERPTIQKTNLSNLGRMNILHGDQKFILELFHQAVVAVNNDLDMAILLTITKFGQKDDRPFDLGSLVDTEGVINVSYHAACTVQSTDPTVDILWSRCGLQEVVGTRGTLFPVYSMIEAANFQSNIDHMPLDVDLMLRQVFREEGCELNFLQLYSVTPHCHELSVPRHPVSRVITMCDLHIEKHRRMIMSNAERYVGYVDDLAQKTVSRTNVRMEGVFLVPAGYQEVLQASHFFISPMLDNLLESVPMIVPFQDNGNGLGLRHVVQPVATYLVTTLFDVLQSSKGLGGFESSWTAFQLELALEELFFGRPVCASSRQYAASLGVSASHPNSLTRMRGFLGLAPVGSASVGESPPPLETWIQDDLQKMRVQRIFPLSDLLLAGPKAVGEELMKILLCDLYQRNDRLPLQTLKGPSRPIGNLVDCRTVGDFCREVCDRKAFGYPHTFGRAVDMVISMHLDPARCLELGMSEMKYFPHIRYWDEQRHLKAKWNWKDYVELHQPNEIPSALSRAAAYRGDVCSRIEELDLSYSRNVKKYREHGMPWLQKCLERLPRGMPKPRVITALVFLSCVGMIQNGDYVSFQKLAEVMRDLPVTQSHLQQLGILSQLLLLQSPAVWRFNEAVPYKLVVPVALPATPARPHRPVQEAKTKVVEKEVEDQPEEEVVERIELTSLPASSHSRWTDLEVSYVDVNPHLSHRRAYELYLTRCRKNSTCVRTFHSFKSKRNRLLSDV